MSETLVNPAVGKLSEIFAEKMAAVLTMSLGTEYTLTAADEFPIEDFLMKDGWNKFIYCESSFTGEIEGQLYFFIEPTYGAKLADLMVMGDGNVEFNEEEHLDALKELANQTFGSFVTEVTTEFDKVIHVEDSDAKFVEKMGLPEPAFHCVKILFDEENFAYFVLSETFLNAFEEITIEKEPIKINPDSLLENNNLQTILNTDLDITIIYGSSKMKISEILNVTDETIIELDKHANEPVDIYVNGKIFAKGEIIVVEKNYGIVIKKIVSVRDRILSLKE